MVNHTPGPWQLTKNDGRSKPRICTFNGGTIAMLPDNMTQTRANGRLIVNAPALIVALKGLLALRSVQTLEEAAREYPHGKKDVADEIAAFNAAHKAVGATKTD